MGTIYDNGSINNNEKNITLPTESGELALLSQTAKPNGWLSSSFGGTNITVASGKTGYTNFVINDSTRVYLINGIVESTVAKTSVLMSAGLKVFSNSQKTTTLLDKTVRTFMNNGGGCTISLLYKPENAGEVVQLETYNYASTSVTFSLNLTSATFKTW